MALLLSQWMLLSSLYSFYFVSTWGCQVVSWSYSCRLRRADPQVGVWQRTRAKNKYKTYDKPHRRPWQWIKIRAKSFNNDGHTWVYLNFQSFYGAPQLSDYEVYQPGLTKGFCINEKGNYWCTIIWCFLTKNGSYHLSLPKNMTTDAQNLKDSYIAQHQCTTLNFSTPSFKTYDISIFL